MKEKKPYFLLNILSIIFYCLDIYVLLISIKA